MAIEDIDVQFILAYAAGVLQVGLQVLLQLKILAKGMNDMRCLYGVFLVLLLPLLSTTTGIRATQGGELTVELSAESPRTVTKPITLFNGKDLDGWKQEGKARWEVKDGLLIGRQGPNGEAGDLLTTASYDDFELVVTYRIQWPANSGVWFRYQSYKKTYQADILEYTSPIAYSGSLFCPGRKFLAINDNAKLVRREGWNKLVIRAQGDRLVISLNEKKVVDIRDDAYAHGRVGFQVHAGDAFTGMQITVKKITLQPL